MVLLNNRKCDKCVRLMVRKIFFKYVIKPLSLRNYFDSYEGGRDIFKLILLFTIRRVFLMPELLSVPFSGRGSVDNLCVYVCVCEKET